MSICSLFAILCLLNFTPSADDTAPDSAKVEELKEIIVEGDTYTRKEDHLVLYMSKENRNFGTNALDAISSMNRFKSDLNGTTLTAIDNEEVFILINGVPADGTLLRTFKAKDIKTLEYYPQAPAKYLAYSTGKILNVVMKQHYDRLYSGYFNLNNAVNTGFGTNQATLSYRDSLNLVTLNYLGDYRKVTDIEMKSHYTHSIGTNSEFDEEKEYRGALRKVSAMYQRFQGLQLFNANLTLSKNAHKEMTDGTGDLTTETGDFQTFGDSRNLKSDVKNADLALYYFIQHKRSGFAINIINSIGKSFSQSEIRPTDEFNWQPSAPENQYNRTDNDNYSFSGVGSYFLPLGGGQFSASLKYSYQHIRSRSSENITKPFSSQYLVYAGWNRSFAHNINMMGYIGNSVNSQHASGITHTSSSPYVNFYVDFWPEGIFKGFSPQLTLQYSSISPSLGNLTLSPTSLNYNFYYIGNPDLKTARRATFKFSLLYSPAKSQNYVAFVINSRYTANPMASVILQDDNISFLSPTNLKFSFNTDYYLYGSLYPAKWLKISPYVELYSFKFNTPSARVRSKYFRYGGSVTVMKDSWSATVAANSPTRTYSGDLTEEGCAQYSVSAQYKYRNWAFGVQGNFRSGRQLTSGHSDSFNYEVIQKWKPLYYLTRINVVYSFSIGRARRHLNKFINESTENSGLNKYNTPQIN